MKTAACAGEGFVLLSLVFWTSCGIVREDRSPCPCTLTVEVKDAQQYPVQLYVNGRAAGTAWRDTCLLIGVEKGPEAAVVAVSGSLFPEDGLLRLPYGEACEALYTFAVRADCSRDRSFVAVQLHSQSCLLQVDLGGLEDCWTRLRGSVTAFSAWDASPVEGTSRLRADAAGRFRLPRQFPRQPLWLDIGLEDGVLRSFPLHEYLQDYDWAAPQLEDISLVLNLSVSEIRVETGFFSETHSCELVL